MASPHASPRVLSEQVTRSRKSELLKTPDKFSEWSEQEHAVTNATNARKESGVAHIKQQYALKQAY